MRVICTFALVGYALASGYLANARRVALHNARFAAGLETYSLSLNQFANYSSDEFAKFIGLRRAVPPTRRDVASGASSNAPPSSVDWRAKGVVGPVPNQGQCAADWAFASVGAVQSAAAIKRGQFVLLSVEVRSLSHSSDEMTSTIALCATSRRLKTARLPVAATAAT